MACYVRLLGQALKLVETSSRSTEYVAGIVVASALLLACLLACVLYFLEETILGVYMLLEEYISENTEMQRK